MIDRLRILLEKTEKTSIVNAAGPLAGVLIPVFLKQGQYHLLFTKRTDRVQLHKGEICFPGGHYEPEDITLLKTALRETNEEIGVPPEDVKVAGALSDTVNAASGFIVSSFVGFIPYPHELKLETEEIEEVLEVPISFLLDPANLKEETWDLHGRKVPIQFYNHNGRIIWGVTWRILQIFLPIWTQAVSEQLL